MSNENKEKSFPEGTADEKELDSVPENQTGSDGEWQWDAAVPETETENITVDELKTETSESKPEKKDEKKSEEKAEKKVEEKSTDKSDSEQDDGRCVVCGNLRGDSPSDLYCHACRKKYLRTSYGVGAVILAFLMVFVAAISYSVCVSTVRISSHVFYMEKYFDEKRYDAINTEYEEMQNEITTLNDSLNAAFTEFNKNYEEHEVFVPGDRCYMIVLRIAAENVTYTPDDLKTFTDLIDAYADADVLEKRSNADLKKVYYFCEELYNITAEVTPEWQAFTKTDEETTEIIIDRDKAMAYIDSLPTGTAVQRCVNDYFRFLTAYYAKDEDKAVLDYFAKAYKEAGEFSYMLDSQYMAILWEKKSYDKLIEIADGFIERNPSDYSANYYAIKANILKNDYKEADRRCENLREASPESLDYYSIKAEVLRRQGKFKEAVEVCRQGNAAGAYDAEIYRQQAIAYMLLDDKKAALEAANYSYDISLQNAYANSNVSLEVFDTTALIAHICGNTELYEEIVAQFEEANMELEKSVLDCIKGEITFEEIFMEGMGDV